MQKHLTKTFAVGADIFHQTAQIQNGSARNQANTGFIWDCSDDLHLLASAGPSIQGPHGYQTYLALLLTFGPPERSAAHCAC